MTDKQFTAFRLHKGGKTYKEIGAEFCVTTQAARQLALKYENKYVRAIKRLEEATDIMCPVGEECDILRGCDLTWVAGQIRNQPHEIFLKHNGGFYRR